MPSPDWVYKKLVGKKNFSMLSHEKNFFSHKYIITLVSKVTFLFFLLHHFLVVLVVYPLTKIYNKITFIHLQQNHSSFFDTINICTIILFVFSNLIRRVSWLSNREEGTFFHIKKPTCPGNEVVYLVTA